MTAVGIGAAAPDFTLAGTRISGGRTERLDLSPSAHRGSPVVLAFSDAEPAAFAGWDGLAAEVWVLPVQDAAPVGYQHGVTIVDPAGLVRWTHSGDALPSATDIRAQLLLMLPGPTGGTFQLPPPG
jgi:hypothetical protein